MAGLELDAVKPVEDEVNEMWNIVAGQMDQKKEKDEEKKKKKKNICVNPKKFRRLKQEKEPISPEELARIVEELMAEFELAHEEDVVLNQQSKPSINKLKKLPLLTESLTKKYLQNVFIDHGIFTLLKNWLEPLPDGSLPNSHIRQEILMILTDKFQFDVNQYFVKDQLKHSGLGKVIMFLSKSEEETKSNQRLAKNLVNKWSRDFYNISTRYVDARPNCNDRVHKKPCIRKPTKKEPVTPDEDIYEFSSGHKKVSKSDTRSRAQIPEANSTSFVIVPPSKSNKKPGEHISLRQENIVRKIQKLKTVARQASKAADSVRLTKAHR